MLYLHFYLYIFRKIHYYEIFMKIRKDKSVYFLISVISIPILEYLFIQNFIISRKYVIPYV